MSIDLDLNDRDVLAAMELRRRDLSDEQLQRLKAMRPRSLARLA